jgi:hypothetical protein
MSNLLSISPLTKIFNAAYYEVSSYKVLIDNIDESTSINLGFNLEKHLRQNKNLFYPLG